MDWPCPHPSSAESLQVLYEAMGPDFYGLLTEELAWELVEASPDVRQDLRDELCSWMNHTEYKDFVSILEGLDDEEVRMEFQEVLSTNLLSQVEDCEYLDELCETLETLTLEARERMLSNAYGVYSTALNEGPVENMTLEMFASCRAWRDAPELELCLN